MLHELILQVYGTLRHFFLEGYNLFALTFGRIVISILIQQVDFFYNISMLANKLKWTMRELAV